MAATSRYPYSLCLFPCAAYAEGPHRDEYPIAQGAGLTGMRIIRAILSGERDLVTLAHMRPRIKSSKTRKVINRATSAFRIAAQSLTHSSSALGGYYRRMCARLGAPEAITAIAHKLARIFYHLWKHGGTYQYPGPLYYEQKYKERVINNMIRKAKQLGFQLNIEPLNELQVS